MGADSPQATTEDVQAPAVQAKRKRGRALAPDELLERAMRVMVAGGEPWDIARKCNCGYATALKLYNQLFEQVWQRVQDEFTPEVLATMKRRTIEHLEEEKRICRKAVLMSFKPRTDIDKHGNKVTLDPKPNVRPYNTFNAAVKQQCAMLPGWNTPTQSMSLQLKANALVDGDAQRQALRSPRVLKAMLELEEALAEEPAKVDEPVVIEIEPGVYLDLAEGGGG